LALNDSRLYSPWRVDFDPPNKTANNNNGNDSNSVSVNGSVSNSSSSNVSGSVSGSVSVNGSSSVDGSPLPTNQVPSSSQSVETHGELCDTIVVGKYQFSRRKFYANRFFNESLSDLYIKNMDLHAYLRPYKFRGNEVWNLYIAW
jgi:hypothetical protein